MKRRFRKAERDGVPHLRTTGWKCPFCDKINNALGIPGMPQTPRPSPGDAVICIECNQVMLIDAMLNPIKPDPADMMARRVADPEFARSIDQAITALRKEFPRS